LPREATPCDRPGGSSPERQQARTGRGGLCTEKLTNYSDAPGRYDGPEGVFPDGKSTCVGPDRESGMRKRGHHYVDTWKLVLDGSGRVERLTHFNNYPEYKAPNPVVSDGGRYMAFQTAKVGGPGGSAEASSSATSSIFLYDEDLSRDVFPPIQQTSLVEKPPVAPAGFRAAGATGGATG
jgi:hypothetical protein